MSETEHEIAWRLSRESWLNHEQALRVLRGLDGDEDRARAWIDAWSRLGRIPYPDSVRTLIGCKCADCGGSGKLPIAGD